MTHHRLDPDDKSNREDRLLDLFSSDPLASCSSTQSICVQQANAGAAEGTVVRALEQTRGKGRSGRNWFSPSGQGLWMSFILRPRVETQDWPALTPLVALSMARALEEIAARFRSRSHSHSHSRSRSRSRSHSPDHRADPPWRVGIKWPNDLQGEHGKLGGIIAEASGGAVVVGVGVNLTQQPAELPSELQGMASSLWMEGLIEEAIHPDTDLSRDSDLLTLAEQVAIEFNEHLTKAYSRFQNGDRSFLRDGLLERFHLRGANIRVEDAGLRIEGRAVDLGPGGELILETRTGRQTLVSGSVVEVLATEDGG